jgi:hypothetical protein
MKSYEIRWKPIVARGNTVVTDDNNSFKGSFDKISYKIRYAIIKQAGDRRSYYRPIL